MIKYIKKIRNYFKNDAEITGECSYCGKHTDNGELYLKFNSFGESETVLTCKKCYSISRYSDINTMGVLSKKQSLAMDIKFGIFIFIILTLLLLFLEY